MWLAGGRRRRLAGASLSLVVLVVAACGDQGAAPFAPVPPPTRSAVLGEYIVHVDLVTGAIDARPSGSLSGMSGGASARLYGAASQIRHWFTALNGGPVVHGNRKQYVLQDRLENLLPYAIGTHVAHAAGALPADTMGVYVFLSIPPQPTAGCTPGLGCTVSVDSADGSAVFTGSQKQSYWYWKTILEPNDGVQHAGLDFSGTAGGVDYARTMSFTASNRVTDFVFGIAVSAAWAHASGNPDTAWAVSWSGDSLPNRASFADLRSEPDWRILGTSGTVDTSMTTTSCPVANTSCLQITTQASKTLRRSLFYYRSDSLGAAENGYVSATVNATGLANGAPALLIGMQDGAKLMQLGVAADLAGLTDSAGTTFVGACRYTRTGAETSWRLAKHGAAVELYTPASATTPKCSTPYASLPNDPYAGARRPFFWFGHTVSPNGATIASRWSSVVYNVGSYTP